MATAHQHQCPKCLQWWYHAGPGDSDFDIPSSAARCDTCLWPDAEPEPDAGTYGEYLHRTHTARRELAILKGEDV